MDFIATSCADFGRLILLKKERIIDIWRHEARAIFGIEIEQSLLDSKASALLGVVAEALSPTPISKESVLEETARATAHGTLRAEQGFDVVQVAREFHILRVAIREACAEVDNPLTEDATSIMAEVIDTAATIGMGRLSEKREEMIRKEDARQMAYIVHDFRAPLGAIALAAAEIVDTMPPDSKTPEIMESLAALERNVARLAVGTEKTMRELARAFTGRGQLQITNLRFHDVVAEIIEQLKTPARANNVILSNQVDVALEVAAAPDALHRILMNLISNALRYTWDGEITIASSQKGADIEVVVQDTGQGIVTEKLARIFEPGEKDPGSLGMGFGLAIAKYLVELQGGRIRIESPGDTGTAAIFTLPRTPR